MTELAFSIEDAGVLEHAAAPTLRFDLRIESPRDIRSVALNVEIRIAATRRAYGEAEQERLVELFGRPEDWGRNLHALHWTTLNVNVPAFSGQTVAELKVPCSYDLEVAGARYMNAIGDGRVPLEFLFSGAVFYTGDGGRLQVGRVGWDQEVDFSLPVALWREAMERHFPGAAWLRLGRESFERLTAYKARHTLLTWEQTVDALLSEAGE
ncbi:MAG: hypothetical protein QOG63_2395 [Thermoleophilaceae bacterium]|nr:hypothetical protein [Thermoleophilaceae bacterium]